MSHNFRKYYKFQLISVINWVVRPSHQWLRALHHWQHRSYSFAILLLLCPSLLTSSVPTKSCHRVLQLHHFWNVLTISNNQNTLYQRIERGRRLSRPGHLVHLQLPLYLFWPQFGCQTLLEEQPWNLRQQALCQPLGSQKYLRQSKCPSVHLAGHKLCHSYDLEILAGKCSCTLHHQLRIDCRFDKDLD